MTDPKGNIAQAYRMKLGRVTTPGGAAGANAAQTVAATVGKLGPLPDGVYTLESTVDCYVLQVGVALFEDPLDAAELAGEGVKVPAGAEVSFNVDASPESDGYLLWVRIGDADGEISVNDRTNARRE
jgi:hypothetical protein